MITRLLTITLGAGALLVLANLLHIISVAYLGGIVSGIALTLLVLHRRVVTQR